MKYEYKNCERLNVQYDWQLNKLGDDGWKLIDVRHKDGEPTWTDDLLFMRETPDPDIEPRCSICGKKDGWFGLHLCSEPAPDKRSEDED